MKHSSGPLKQKLLVISSILSVMMFALLISQIGFVVYPRMQAGARDFLKEKNRSLSIYIEAYFEEIQHTLQTLSRYPEIIRGPDGTLQEQQRAIEFFEIVRRFNPHISYVYAVYTDGKVLGKEYTHRGSAQQFSWYQFMQNYVGVQDYVIGVFFKNEDPTQLLLSSAHVLVTERFEYKGVVVIDSYVNVIAEQLYLRSSFYKSSYSFILNKEKEAIVHPRKELIGVNFNDAVVLHTPFMENEFIQYSFEGVKKIAYANYLKAMDWYVVTTVDEQELFKPALQAIIIYGIELLVFVVLFSFVNYQLWEKEVIIPLLGLQKFVQCITEQNTACTIDGFNMPNNEIGEIARRIGDLASQSLYQKNKELEEKNRILESLAIRDFLTGLFNRRHFEEIVQSEYDRFMRYRDPLAMIMYDIDHFKYINDSYGHQEGDRILKELTALISHHIRKTDVHARWGGEEFMILLPQTSLTMAWDVAEKIRQLVESYDFKLPQSVTISAGVTVAYSHESFEQTISRVDYALYTAKRMGRNRVHQAD
ncbi:MAG: diguanylate cyclase [Treponemataceae bacterium]|nr:diguanylate cyclase [Treponemataceae bacterium]